jgi:alkylation response protein AidB-like acyl-CoA dehydrogenase
LPASACRRELRFLSRILCGEDRWCQGFSEPGSGSDLASLSTRAVLDGDRWIVDGQKLWTSRAREANWIFLLARTNAAAPKNRGISFLLVPLAQPGIDVRPIKSMSGESEFNEVFFDGATTPADHIVGEIDGGWAVASTLLGLERGEEAATNPILFRAELDRLVAMAHERGRTADPLIQQRLGRWASVDELIRVVQIAERLGYGYGRSPTTPSVPANRAAGWSFPTFAVRRRDHVPPLDTIEPVIARMRAQATRVVL